ncbi:MAG TPA: glycine--tRNA ligase subunit beta [Burkholderiales bacterium]|nr:glycine--tRNA ligase subunit beta [Burkholderiales bacterium]
MEASLLIELLTEELPPKALPALGRSFAEGVRDDLVSRGLLAKTNTQSRWFATPRRLAVLIPKVSAAGQDRTMEITGPSASAPAAAIAGFAKKHGVEVAALEQRDTPKGKIVVAKTATKGVALEAVLAEIVAGALKKLPVPKVMRWGAGEAQFVRPVHGLVMLHGVKVVQGEVLGARSGNKTRGHRFLGKEDIALASADDYESRLLDEGRVIADFAKRRGEIDRQLQAEATKRSASLADYQGLLDEVTALVEYPSVYAAGFDKAFLAVPQECLILTMRQNQKYFPLFDGSGKLTGEFLIVSNMRVADPRPIVRGNERVVRPRLEDARFFFDQDRKQRLEERVPQLGKVVYHSKLGTQLERVERMQLLAGTIARALQAEAAHAERAAWLSKADLLTGMVGEFPELQGIMGRYYARHDGEPAPVADAIEAHYRPRFSGDRLPEGAAACAVALADKLDALAGLFGIGQTPTGEKDPFALRRAALGLVRILVERKLACALPELLAAAAKGFAGKPGYREPSAEVADFVYERARHYFAELGYSTNEIEAVLCLRPARLDLVPKQLEAVRAFSAMPEADSLAAANKRIGNILKQAGGAPGAFDASLLAATEEKHLAALFGRLRPQVERAFADLDYAAGLRALASLKTPVDAFFDKVMVMDKDPRVRSNRIAFLGALHGTMNRIADLSKLAK